MVAVNHMNHDVAEVNGSDPPIVTRVYVKAGLWTLDWTRGLDYGLDYGLSFGLSRLMLPDVTVCKWLKLLFKVPWALAKAF